MRCVIEKNDCHTDGEGDHCLKKDECCTAKNKKVDCPADTNPNRADEMVSCINTKHHTCCSDQQETGAGHVKDVYCTAKEIVPDVGQDSAPRVPHSAPSIGSQKHPRAYGACESHLQRAFDQYARYLETGRCICRSVLSRLDGCCGNPAIKQPATSNPTK